MKMQYITFLLFAGFTTALSVPCGSTYNFGGTHSAAYVTCAANQQNGGGGSAIITHNGYYCLKAMYAYWSYGAWVVHYDLLKGVNCGPWQPGDYCYAPISPYDCSKDMTNNAGWYFGNPNGAGIQYTQSIYLNGVATSNAPFNPTMVFHNASFVAYGGKRK